MVCNEVLKMSEKLEMKIVDVPMEEFLSDAQSYLTNEILNDAEDVITTVYGSSVENESKILNYLADEVEEVYKLDSYLKHANVKLAMTRVFRRVRDRAKELKKLGTLEIVDTFVGMYVGGEDWRPFRGNDIPTKQDFVFITTDGEFRTAGVFGHNLRGHEEESLEVGKWYEVSFVDNPTPSGKVYRNPASIEEVSSPAMETLDEVFANVAIPLNEVVSGDATSYKYKLIRAKISGINPIDIKEDDLSEMPTVYTDRDGNERTYYKKVKVGIEPFVQNGQYVFELKLTDVDGTTDGDERNFLSVSFYPQYLGKKTAELGFEEFLDDLEAAKSLDDYQLSTLVELISMSNIHYEVYVVAKLTSYNRDRNNEDITWIKGSGVFVKKA